MGTMTFSHHLEILLGRDPAITMVGLLQDGIDPRRIRVCHEGYAAPPAQGPGCGSLSHLLRTARRLP